MFLRVSVVLDSKLNKYSALLLLIAVLFVGNNLAHDVAHGNVKHLEGKDIDIHMSRTIKFEKTIIRTKYRHKPIVLKYLSQALPVF